MSLSLEYHLASLRSLDITETDCRALQCFKPALDSQLTRLLDRFYDRIDQDTTARNQSYDAHPVATAKQALTDHWAEMFNDIFDLAYLESIQRMGLVYVTLGLEPTWHTVGYSQVIFDILSLAERFSHENDQDPERLSRAIIKVVMLDVESVVSTHKSAQQEFASQRISDLLTSFEASAMATMDRLHVTTQAISQTLVSSSQSSTGDSLRIDTPSRKAERRVHQFGQSVANSAALLSSLSPANPVLPDSTLPCYAFQVNHKDRSPITSVAEAGKRMSHIVGLIRRIAGQANLLALNATMEATRAGDAGKRFKLVANEVCELAAQTATASHAIAMEIGDTLVPEGTSIQSSPSHSPVVGHYGMTQSLAGDIGLHGVGSPSKVSNAWTGSSEPECSVYATLKQLEELSQQTSRLRTTIGTFIQDLRAFH